MSSASLPVDPEKPGNVWCEACQQSIGDNRAAAHLVSKKHLGNASPPADAKSKKGAKPVPPATDDDVDDNRDDAGAIAAEPEKKTAGKGAGKHPSGLPEDPDKVGYRWCGICQVSLASGKATAHIETARHNENAMKCLTSAMKATRMSTKSSK